MEAEQLKALWKRTESDAWIKGWIAFAPMDTSMIVTRIPVLCNLNLSIKPEVKRLVYLLT